MNKKEYTVNTVNSQIIDPWIELGYSIFAEKGPEGLKVERLSKTIGKNKSSFYHHFADLPIFTEHLLNYHIQQIHIITRKQIDCRSREEFIAILLEHKNDVLFNRQLRFHNEDEAFNNCFKKTNQMLEAAIIPIWSQMLNLKNNTRLSTLLFKLSIDNFLLQTTKGNLNKIWIENYLFEISNLINSFKK